MKSAPDISQRQDCRKQNLSAPTFQLGCDETVGILKNTHLEILMLEKKEKKMNETTKKQYKKRFIYIVEMRR